MSDEIRVREATPGDAAAILGFIKGLAAFEGEPETTVKTSESDIRRHGFGAERHFETLIAELDGGPVGFALFYPNYSTWEGRPGLYLEDLFVDEQVRGRGVGQALMLRLREIAEERGWGRLDLAVLDWNPAREFYQRLGMRHEREWLIYRLEVDGERD